jgi:simple sugar transport system ATP-binding protein
VTSALVRLVGVSKSFGAARALSRVDLALRTERVHAVVGENGAGKSTLLKIAAGVHVADEGEVIVGDSPLQPANAREAIRRGVGMVHQHFMLVPTLTALENLALGHEPTRFGRLDLSPLRAKVRAWLDELKIDLPLDVPVEQLDVGERQRLEIARVIVRGARVIILDEPTAVLAPMEAHAMLSLARSMAGRGVAVAIVTHRLDEVAEFADEVTVLRRGERVSHHDQGDATIKDVRALAREALGDADLNVTPRARAVDADAKTVLDLRDVVVDAAGEGGAPLRGVSLSVRAREIVGVAGVEGNGQWALERAIAGELRCRSGTIVVDGVDRTRDDVRARRDAGLAWIPSDRHRDGIADDLSVADVTRLGALREVSPDGVRVDDAALDRAHADAVRDFDVRPADPRMLAGALSGGNQQKVVVARELRDRGASQPMRLVLAAQPTRGVDARASATLRSALVRAADRGAGVLLVSSDLSELRAISDRIVVLRAGRVAAELPPTADVDAIGAAMLGESKGAGASGDSKAS